MASSAWAAARAIAAFVLLLRPAPPFHARGSPDRKLPELGTCDHFFFFSEAEGAGVSSLLVVSDELCSSTKARLTQGVVGKLAKPRGAHARNDYRG